MPRKRVRITIDELEALDKDDELCIKLSCLSVDLIRGVSRLIKDGITPNDAATLMGISESTHRSYMRRGAVYIAALETKLKPNINDKLAAIYYQQAQVASAKFRKKVITRSITPDWFTDTWIRDMTVLERRDPNNWAKRAPDPVVDESQYRPDESFM